MADFTQEGRLIQIETPLGPDVLILESFQGVEEMSRPFQFRLRMFSHRHDIAFKDIVTKNVTVKVEAAENEFRYFNGHISRFEQLDNAGIFAVYEADLVPWLWFFSHTNDCRIYQDKTAVEIIEDVFQRMGLKHFERKLNGSPGKREYCVQYRESALQFVSRLMEEEGIYYYFKHEANRHVLVMGDHKGAPTECPGKSFRMEPSGGSGYDRREDFVQGWRRARSIRPNRRTLTDYNFKTATTGLLQQTDTASDIKVSPPLEIYDYPGIYLTTSEGEAITRRHMEEEEAAGSRISGRGTCRVFSPGYRFQLEDHPRTRENGEYLLTTVRHEAHSNIANLGMGAMAFYRNEFTALPRDLPYRPPRITPKPIVYGVQTAVVTGPPGEEIHTDEYGRIKVQFHWDRQGKKDDKSSCWMRVAQPTAGGGWGSFFLPRIGFEVVVSFLEGDPDRPLVTGCVYNSTNKPAKALPANKTQSGIRSNSTKGGAGFNEIRFEDKKGEEHMFIHSQKNKTEIVKQDVAYDVGGSEEMYIQGDRTVSIGGSEDLTLAGDRTEQIGGSLTSMVGAMRHEMTGGSHLSQVAGAFGLVVGSVAIIECSAGLILKGPGGFISIGPSGIDILGTMVKINSGGSASPAQKPSQKSPKKAKKAAMRD